MSEPMLKRQKSIVEPWLVCLKQRTVDLQGEQLVSDAAEAMRLNAECQRTHALVLTCSKRVAAAVGVRDPSLHDSAAVSMCLTETHLNAIIAKRAARTAALRADKKLSAFNQRHDYLAVPLDWCSSLYTSTWTRTAHAAFPNPVNAVLTAFFLGLSLLVAVDEAEVPDVDPEVLEEAIGLSVFLYDGGYHVDMPEFTGMVRREGGREYASGAVRARVSYDCLFTGVVCGKKAFGTHTTNTTAGLYTRRSYAGNLLVHSTCPSTMAMCFSGDGELVHHDDGSMYRGNFRYGLYYGIGTMYDAAGTVLYKGHWNTIPDGAGSILITKPDVLPRVYLVGTFAHTNIVGKFTLTDEFGAVLSDASTAEFIAAADTSFIIWNYNLIDNASGRCIAMFGQSLRLREFY